MMLKAEKVTFKNRKRVKEIYVSSFPKEERMPFLLMLLMSKMKNTKFLCFRNEGKDVCGLAYLGAVNHVTFIMFLAVSKTARSKGYGSCMLKSIELLYPENKIIVSIERCDENVVDIEKRIRRKKFYIKNGYQETGYLVKLPNILQEVLIKNGEFDEEEFSSFFKKYSNGAMKPKIMKKDG